MAFPIPDYLPRNAFSRKESSSVSGSSHWDAILSDISTLSWDALTPEQASLWTIELSNEINATRSLISASVQRNLSSFDRQLQAAISIQSRIEDLSAVTEKLTSSLHDETIGLAPSLRRTVASHAAAAQEAKDAEVLAGATKHLLACRHEIRKLSFLVSESRLVDAVVTSRALTELLLTAPEPLPSTHVFQEIQSRAGALRDTTFEQLDNGFSRAVSLATTSEGESITILCDVCLPPGVKSLSLAELSGSMNEDSILQKLISLRKNLMSRFVPPILKHTHVVVMAECTLFLNRAPSKSPILHISALVEFLSTRLFQFLPPKLAAHAVDDLSLPLLSSVLESFHSEIPNSIGHLPSYITFVQDGVQFEESLNTLRQKHETEDPLRALKILTEWSLSLHSHYGKKRRQSILEDARKIIVDERKLAAARIDKREVSTSQYLASVAPTSSGSVPNGSRTGDGLAIASDHNISSALRPPATPAEPHHIIDGEDGWGFDDEELEPAGENVPDSSTTNGGELAPEIEEIDPWECDPWDEPPGADSSSVKSSEPVSAPSSYSAPSTAPIPKAINGPDKFKGKNLPSSSSLEGPMPLTPPTESRELDLMPGPFPSQSNGVLAQPSLARPVERYLVSECARSLFTLCKSIMQESYELSTSGIFSHGTGKTVSSDNENANAGSIIESSIASLCDLFRALHPVVHASKMKASVALRIRLSNDCSYLSGEIDRIAQEPIGLRQTDIVTLSVVSADLRRLSEKYLENCLHEQRTAVTNLLKHAERFEETGDDTRFSACESVVNNALLRINTIAQDWKTTLTQSTYLEAMGSLVEEVLTCVLNDILALPDIPEKESHRLNALCLKLESLKEHFVVVPSQDNVVAAHVSSWFKFAYLAELLEASLADITYLFENGALIDFEIRELVKLVQGLFADTLLRSRTIEKIKRGHPNDVQSG